MLAKMVIHGLAAAIVIGSAAGLYAQVTDGYVWASEDGRRDKHHRDHHEDD